MSNMEDMNSPTNPTLRRRPLRSSRNNNPNYADNNNNNNNQNENEVNIPPEPEPPVVVNNPPVPAALADDINPRATQRPRRNNVSYSINYNYNNNNNNSSRNRNQPPPAQQPENANANDAVGGEVPLVNVNAEDAPQINPPADPPAPNANNDPFAATVEQMNRNRHLVTALMGATDGHGNQLNAARAKRPLTSTTEMDMFTIQGFGKFGVTMDRAMRGSTNIKLACIGSSSFGGQGECKAIICIPKNNGILDYTNSMNWSKSKSTRIEYRTHFHDEGCQCLQMPNVQNRLMTELNLFASASAIFPRIETFSTTDKPFDSITPDLSAVGHIIQTEGQALSCRMNQVMEVGFLPLLEMITTAHTGGYLGGSRVGTLKQILSKHLLSEFGVNLLQKCNAVGIKALLGYGRDTAPPLLWDPSEGTMVENGNQRLEICRGACRLLITAMLNLVEHIGVVSNVYDMHTDIISCIHIKLTVFNLLFLAHISRRLYATVYLAQSSVMLLQGSCPLWKRHWMMTCSLGTRFIH